MLQMLLFFVVCVLLLPRRLCGECTKELVEWVWMGAVDINSLQLTIGFDMNGCNLDSFLDYMQLQVQNEANQAYKFKALTPLVLQAQRTLLYRLQLQNLPAPDTRYAFTIGVPQQIYYRGNFKTMKTGKQSFRFAFSSCADQLADAKVFHTMKALQPQFFIHMGDLHYENIGHNEIQLFRKGYVDILRSPVGQAMLQMQTPVIYMWDDHDYGPDNSDKTAGGRESARQSYREFVPHYPLTSQTGSIEQAFTVGRVRFIVTDLRSERSPNTEQDSAEKSVLGEKQKTWFKNELIKAAKDPAIGIIVWCSTMPWIDDERKWGHFKQEQQELVAFIQQRGITSMRPIYIISGDAHMLAVDDGSHSPGGLPVFHAAALGRPGSIKGGPYSHGALPGSGQFGIMDVTDHDNGTICLHFYGKNANNETLLEYSTCNPTSTPGTKYEPPPIWVRKLLRVWKKICKRVVDDPSIILFAVQGFLVLLGLSLRCMKKATAPIKRD